MFRKIITYFLILAVVLPILASAVPFGVGNQVLGVKISYAQEDETTVTQTVETKKGDTTETVSKVTKKTSSDGEVYDPCGWFFGAGQKGGIIECLSYTITGILYDYVLQGTIWIAGLAGTLFNASIQFSLTGKVFDASENGNIMIKDGWTMVRDLLNLVFIFILLFAAISTILQYGNMDIKKVLPSLIVAALLVNFSMMISKMVIDASHIFAWEFYNQIDVKNEKGLGDGKMFANIKNDINVYGEFEKKNLANVFIAGFNPQELLTGKEAKEGEEDKNSDKSLWKQVVEAKRDEGVNINGVWWQAALIILLESALALFAGFVLLAGAIMFVVRVVVLWLVMIFSPIAFLGMILPSMGKYSKMWWEYLINQSFFAPAFLFLFMLVTKFINSKFIESIFQVSKNSDPMIVWGINGGTIALTFFHFFVVGGLMMACLIVARQLGGKTAEFGIKWAHKGKELALGATKFGINNRGTRYLGGKAGDSNWWKQSIGRIPGGNILGRKLGAMKKSDEDKARKAAEKYAGTLSSAGRKSLARDMEGRGFMKRLMYTGPEGAFTPGKEGYEKIIAKKNAEKEEEDSVFKKRMELMGGEKEFLDKFSDIGSGDSEEAVRQKIYNAKQRAKSLIRQGDTAELDKLIEEKDKTEEEKNEIERDNIVKEKRRLKLEIGGYEDSLKEARKRGDAKDIKFQEGLLLGSLTDTDNLEKELIEIVTKEKHRENLQKTVDKYDDKQRAKAGKPEEKKEKETKSK